MSTKQQAKGMAQNKLSRSSDPNIRFIADTTNEYYARQKADSWKQYNTQLQDARLWAQNVESNNINAQRRQSEQRIADNNRASLEAEKNRAQQMSLARQQQFGDARTTGVFSVSNTTYEPTKTLEWRMMKEQQDANAQQQARDYRNQVDMMNRQASLNAQTSAQQRAFQAQEAAKDRSASMQQSMWNSFVGAGQYNYRYW